MKTSIKKLPKAQLEILFEISTEEFKDFIERTISELTKDSEFKGFRKGNVPREVVIEKIGQEKILASVLQLAIKENYFQAVRANKIEVISRPEIKILSKPTFNQGLSFKARFSVMPDVNLPDYRKIVSETKRKEVSVPEKEIENTLSWLRKSRSKSTLKNQPAQIKDFVEIEFSSPQIEEDRKRNDHFVLGEGSFVKGFEKQLINMSSGEEKEFSLIFPQNHSHKDLAGKEVHFRVKMKSVQKIILPEINDQFAQSLGEFKNLAALKESIKGGIKQEKENQESQRIRQEILEKISQKTKIDIPKILIETERTKIFENFKKLVSEKLKVSFKDYLTKTKKTEKEFLDKFSLEAEKKIRYSLSLREIAKQEKIGVSEEEIKVEINKVFKKYQSIEKAERELDLKKIKSYYKEVIQNEKTLQFLESLSKK